jgi:cell division protease FtsH
MDGFEPTEKVIVMAATNRPDVLDPALLRPGRFDRRVQIDPPDRGEREDILKVHSRKKPLHADVSLAELAKRTPGFSGADLANLMNEGAILTARESRKEITQYDLLRSIEKVMLGPERKSHILNAEEKKITAYHEAGHAIVASLLEYADPVHKVSVISRGRAAGYTLKLPDEDKRMQSRKEFLDDIAVSMAGYVTEKMIFGDLTTGPSNDLAVSTNLARHMVARWGMSDAVGPVVLEDDGARVTIGGGVMASKEYSERVGSLLDEEVRKIITEQMARAESLIVKHRAALDAVAMKLVEVETLEREDYEKVIVAHGIVLKPKKSIEQIPQEIVS